jgi:hypothetical protein
MRANAASLALRSSEYLLLAAVVAGFLDTLRFAAYYIPLRFAVDYQEGSDLLAALRITHGQTPYPSLGHLPYVMSVYGPVYYYAIAPLVKWFGLGFTAPRLFVLASGLAATLFLILLLRRWTGSWMIALGFGLLFPAVSLVRDWIYVLRVDLFGLVLTLAGLCVFVARRRLMAPALLFVAALFAKITFLAAPIACFLFLMVGGEPAGSGDDSRGRGSAWRFAGWMMAFGLAGLAALGLATRGRGLFHMFLTHADPYSLSHYVAIIGHFVWVDAALLVAAAALAVRDFRRRALSLPLIYFILASVTTLTAGKFGSASNHLLEWQAAMCLAAGCGYHALRKRPKIVAVPALIPIGVVVLVLLGLSESLQLNPDLTGCEAAYRYGTQQPGALLSENPGAAVLSGKKVWLSSSFEYAFLGKAGLLDERPLARLVEQKFFGVILLDDDLAELERRAGRPQAPETIWPPGFVAALAQNYHQAAGFACLGASAAFVPNPNLAPTPSPSNSQ